MTASKRRPSPGLQLESPVRFELDPFGLEHRPLQALGDVRHSVSRTAP